jgi:outer membrane receptor protein involved in Fe transport
MRQPSLPGLVLLSVSLSAAAVFPQEEKPRPGRSLLEKLGDFDDFEDLELDDLLNVTVSIAAGRTQTLEEAPSIVSVVTDEEIRRMGARTLEEVLETVPGVEVLKDNVGRGRIVIRGVPGGLTSGSSENVLVLFNGHRLNEDISGGATIVNRDFPVDNIKKIEIIRGPGSALFGANAFLGVINIVTYSSDTFRGLEVAAGGGSFDTRQASVLFGKTAGEVGLSGFVQWSDTNGAGLLVPADVQTFADQALAPFGIPPASRAPGPVVDDRRTFDANASLAYKGLTLGARLKHEDAGGFIGPSDVLGPGNRAENRQLGLDAAYHRPLGEKTDLRGRLAFTQSGEGQFVEALPPGAVVAVLGGFVQFPGGATVDARANSRRFGGEITLERQVFRGNTTTLGVGLERESTFDVRTQGNFDARTGAPLAVFQPLPPFIPPSERRIFSVFAQDTWNPARRVGITAGVRWDDYSDFGSTVNPRAAVVLRLPRDLNLKFLYGRAFRAPTFLELFFDFLGIVGNPSLQPATINTFEVALGYRRRGLRVSANVYANYLRDLIVTDRPFDPTQRNNFVNSPGVDARGVELELVRTVGRRHALRLGYAYQDAKDRSTGGALADIPKHLGSIGGTLGVGRYLSVTPTLLVRGSRARSVGDPRPPVDGYALLNLNVRAHELFKRLELSAGVNNAFDEEYFDPSPSNGVPGDYPRPGRRVFVKAAWKF